MTKRSDGANFDASSAYGGSLDDNTSGRSPFITGGRGHGMKGLLGAERASRVKSSNYGEGDQGGAASAAGAPHGLGHGIGGISTHFLAQGEGGVLGGAISNSETLPRRNMGGINTDTQRGGGGVAGPGANPTFGNFGMDALDGVGHGLSVAGPMLSHGALGEMEAGKPQGTIAMDHGLKSTAGGRHACHCGFSSRNKHAFSTHVGKMGKKHGDAYGGHEGSHKEFKGETEGPKEQKDIVEEFAGAIARSKKPNKESDSGKSYAVHGCSSYDRGDVGGAHGLMTNTFSK